MPVVRVSIVVGPIERHVFGAVCLLASLLGTKVLYGGSGSDPVAQSCLPVKTTASAKGLRRPMSLTANLA
jgi:hypothetical protein